MVVAYMLLAVSSCIIGYQDIRRQMFSLGALGLFGIAALQQQYIAFNIEGIWCAGALLIILGSCQRLWYTTQHKPMMGKGDIILAPICGLWLQLADLPIFLTVAGVLALLLAFFWRYQWQMSKFPLTPAFLLALLAILVMRCIFCETGL